MDELPCKNYDRAMGSFQGRVPREGLISVEEAQTRVLAEVAALDAEHVPLTEAHGRVLREDVAAPSDVPPADNSAMDGYALRASDVANASEASPVRLRVI